MDVVQVKMDVKSVDGFSGHSDRKQLLKFVNSVSPRPKQVLVVHGEESKCLGMADCVRRYFRVDASAPSVGDRLRVK
jgi:predicted metal-dependent RNase